MSIMDKKTFLSLPMIALSCFLTLSISKMGIQSTAASVDDLRSMNSNLKSDIHVLRAEIAHLSNAGRIRDIAKTHLSLEEAGGAQVKYLTASVKVGEFQAGFYPPIKLSKVSWRFKSREMVLKKQ